MREQATLLLLRKSLMPAVTDLETIRTLARIRKLLDDGYRIKEVEKLTGWSKQRIWNTKNGVSNQKTSLPLNELNLRKPSRPGILCRKCGEAPRIFCKSGVCLECEIVELAKIGLVVILEPEE